MTLNQFQILRANFTISSFWRLNC